MQLKRLMLFLNEAIPEGFSSTSYIKYWGAKRLCEVFCPAPTFVTADSDDARNPQHFIYVTVGNKCKKTDEQTDTI